MNLPMDVLKHIFYYDYNTSYLIKRKIQKPIYEDYEFLITYYIVFEDSVFPDYLKPYISYDSTTINKDTICLSKFKSDTLPLLSNYENIKIVNSGIIGENNILDHLPNILIRLCLDLSKNIVSGECLKQFNPVYLNLSNNNIIAGEYVEHLTNLTYLSLSGNNKIRGEHIQNLTKLEYLDLTHNYTVNGEHIKHLTNLNMLNLSYNDTITVNDIKHLNITNLVLLGKTKIKGKDITNLKKLIELRIGNCDIGGIHIKHLINLETLIIIDNRKIKIKHIQHLENLKKLMLVNYSSDDGNCLKNLKQLSHLGLGMNGNITGKHLINITNLKRLSLYCDRVIKIEDIEKMHNLKEICIYNSEFITVDDIKNNTKLAHLTIVEWDGFV